MKRPAGKVGRADLLRALNAAAGDEARQKQLAAQLEFVWDPKAPPAPEFCLHAESAGLTSSAEVGGRLVVNEPLPQPGAPLRAPLFGIVKAESVAPPASGEAPPSNGEAPNEYGPRSSAPLKPQPLLTAEQLTRRLRQALAQPAPGRALDMPRVVEQLAQARLPQRWPYRARPYPPDHVSVVVDRSQHLRPYFADQQLLLDTLAQWLGVGGISSYTIDGDPWRPLTHWSRGKLLARPRRIDAPPPGSVLLLLTDLGCLRGDADHAAPLARWSRAQRHWRQRGGRVVFCPPMRSELLPADWCDSVDCLSLTRQVFKKRRFSPDSAAQVAAETGKQLERLLTLLSFTRRIEPELVRAVRLLDPALAAEPGLEALLWSRKDVIDASYELCVWRHGAALPYRKAFSAIAPGLQQAVFRAMRTVHAVRGRVIEVQETLAWASHVDTPTREPFASEIEEAARWMEKLPFEQTTGDAADPNFVIFARQTHAAQGEDPAMMGCFAKQGFGQLWALAYADALRAGRTSPSPGELPAEMLPQWVVPPPAQRGARGYRLEQIDDRLVLNSGIIEWAGAVSPIGQPLAISSLLLTVQPGGHKQFGYPQGHEFELGTLHPGKRFGLHTGALALRVEEIGSPLHAARQDIYPDPPGKSGIVERGRDRHGLYVDVLIEGEHGSATQRLRYIEPGQFLMGSPDDEENLHPNENPQHRVVLSEGVWLGDTACTQGLWQAVMGENPSKFSEKNGGGAAHPVERVSWLMVQDFLQKLEALLPGCRASLPTEAEWEYACRAGSTGPYSFGETISPDQVNYNGNYPYGDAARGEYRARTVKVKELLANAWGLYQMHGNVWEWCADRRRDYTNEAVVDPGLAEALAPLPEGKAACTLRGGSWIGDSQLARSACRYAFVPVGSESTGFRFALRPTKLAVLDSDMETRV